MRWRNPQHFESAFFPPEVTLSAFLSQVLSADHSCRETVARVVADRILQGKPACSAKTSSYCKARSRFEEWMLAELARAVAEDLERDSIPSWGWGKKKRRVKPQRPSWMDKETYAKMPPELIIREVRERRQSSDEDLVVATTLLSPNHNPKQKLIELYRDRWCCELDLRSIKSTMQMGILRCKTPQMVRKEIWAQLLAYNLIRKVIAQAAEKHDVRPREISFKGALQTINVFLALSSVPGAIPQNLYDEMLAAIASHRVGDRPGRREPRAVKRRPKLTRWLKVPRAEARKALQ